MANRHSIFFKLNLIFTITLLSLVAIYMLLIKNSGEKHIHDIVSKVPLVLDTLHYYKDQDPDTINQLLAPIGFKTIQANRAIRIIREGHIPPFFSISKKTM